MLNFNSRVPNPTTRTNKSIFIDHKNKLLQILKMCGLETKTDLQQIEKRYKDISAFALSVKAPFDIYQSYFECLDIYEEYVIKRKGVEFLARPTRIRPADLKLQVDALVEFPLVNKDEIAIRDSLLKFMEYKPKGANCPMEFQGAISLLISKIIHAPLRNAFERPSPMFAQLQQILRLSAFLTSHRVY